jgi:exopolysaccharide biosynthesis polyprenyl glycosylphosphotransferase
MLYIEQKRTERSKRRFVLMLLESTSILTTVNGGVSFDQILDALASSTRETDITGWYKDGSIIGTIFTEIGSADGKAVATALLAKVSEALANTLGIEGINQIHLSFHVFPDEWGDRGNGHSTKSSPFPNSAPSRKPRTMSVVAKRILDIIGSLIALAIFAPVFLGVALAVKFTSKGPILFRQQRVGQYGKTFTFLKFRSMQSKNDQAVHREYIKNFIAGATEPASETGPRPTVFKIKDDPRLTPIGAFLRRTSLDELPQFINVLKGEMSLVGPRPPITYEVDCYDVWHRRRLLVVKPGITGLWQVTGRSRVTFDEMVRLDLKYAKSWSIWLDIKILLQTPKAVLGGQGAY